MLQRRSDWSGDLGVFRQPLPQFARVLGQHPTIFFWFLLLTAGFDVVSDWEFL